MSFMRCYHDITYQIHPRPCHQFYFHFLYIVIIASFWSYWLKDIASTYRLLWRVSIDDQQLIIKVKEPSSSSLQVAMLQSSINEEDEKQKQVKKQ